MLRVLIINIIVYTLVNFLPQRCNAQRWEIGGLLGSTNYIGDINKNPVITQSRPGINLWGRRNLTRHFSYRFGIGYGQIRGHDSLSSAGKLRGLGFKSNIWEFSNIFEFHYNPFGLQHMRKSHIGLTHPKNKRSSFYVFTGISVFAFNPKGYQDGKWTALQPLGTEGQTLEGGKGAYSKISVAIPFGAGIKYKMTDNWIFGVEIGYRTTFTDYLDDVSGNYPDLNKLAQKNGLVAVGFSDPTTKNSLGGEGLSSAGDMRGDRQHRDWYIFSGITISYRFTPISCVYRSKRRRFQNVD